MAEHKMVLILVSLCCIGLVTAQDPVVDTSSGKCRGKSYSVPKLEGRGMSFLGIPYAEPPVGNRRFEPPEPKKPWTGEYDATEFGPMCPQDPALFVRLAETLWKLNFTGEPALPLSEDCLTLDVYTANLTASRPVMVYIHGGGFRVGSSRMLNGKYIAIKKKVVMVSIQYRLGALGFLATSDGTVKGNMGLKDQVEALKWVQGNIAKFGGDPNRVTIFGVSAGSISVSLHLVSPISKGLFQNAILQSGSNLHSKFFAPPSDLVGRGRWLADVIGCKNATDDMIACLRYLSHTSFWTSLPSITTPTVDGDFLPDTPQKLLNQGVYNKDVNVLGGIAEYEGYMLSIIYNSPYLGSKLENSPFKSPLINNLMDWYVAPNKQDKWQTVLNAILDKYSINLEEGTPNKKMAKMLGDAVVTANVYQTMKLLSEKLSGNVYFYEFQYRPSLSVRPDYISADHLDDTLFVGMTSSESIMGQSIVPTEDDLKMDEITMDYWAKFAETGNPNGDNQPIWPSFRENEGYMKLKVPPVEAHTYRSSNIDFWLDTVPEMLSDKPSGTQINIAKIEHILLIMVCIVII